MKRVKCNQCGKEFFKPLSEIKRMESRKWTNHFCNTECLSEFGIISKKNKTQEKINDYYKNPKKCLNCDNVIPYKDKLWKKYCSSKCSAIFTQKNGGHYRWSDECKKQLGIRSKNNPKFCGWNKGVKTAKRKSISCIICKKIFEEKVSILKNRIGVCSKECRKKIQSINLTNEYKSGRSVTGGTTKWLKYKNIKVQGSYEYRTCLILDKWIELNKIKWWEYTNDRFEYIGVDNKTHNYLLDFKIWNNDGTFYYLETKGYEKENDKFKWKSVRDKGFNLVVWFLQDLIREENNCMVHIA